MVVCSRMGKIYTTKTPSGDFKVTIPENPLLSKQVVTSKGILVPYTNLQLNLYPIPNWTCSVVTITPSNAWLPVCGLLTNLKMLAAKFFSSSHDKDHKSPWL